jgi:hypothetical protein
LTNSRWLAKTIKKINFFSGLDVRCPTLDGRLFMFNLQMEVFYEMFDFGEGF